MIINIILYTFSGISETSSQASDLNGNRNTKTFAYPRDGPYMPQLSESHEHQLYSNRFVSIILYLPFLLNNYVIFSKILLIVQIL